VLGAIAEDGSINQYEITQEAWQKYGKLINKYWNFDTEYSETPDPTSGGKITAKKGVGSFTDNFLT